MRPARGRVLDGEDSRPPSRHPTATSGRRGVVKVSLWRRLVRRRALDEPGRVRMRQGKCRTCRQTAWLLTGSTDCDRCAGRRAFPITSTSAPSSRSNGPRRTSTPRSGAASGTPSCARSRPRPTTRCGGRPMSGWSTGPVTSCRAGTTAPRASLTRPAANRCRPSTPRVTSWTNRPTSCGSATRCTPRASWAAPKRLAGTSAT